MEDLIFGDGEYAIAGFDGSYFAIHKGAEGRQDERLSGLEEAGESQGVACWSGESNNGVEVSGEGRGVGWFRGEVVE
ncbi:MAG: hypothetical protein RL215_398 [Planctomycetota bacterium]